MANGLQRFGRVVGAGARGLEDYVRLASTLEQLGMAREREERAAKQFETAEEERLRQEEERRKRQELEERISGVSGRALAERAETPEVLRDLEGITGRLDEMTREQDALDQVRLASRLTVPEEAQEISERAEPTPSPITFDTVDAFKTAADKVSEVRGKPSVFVDRDIELLRSIEEERKQDELEALRGEVGEAVKGIEATKLQLNKQAADAIRDRLVSTGEMSSELAKEMPDDVVLAFEKRLGREEARQAQEGGPEAVPLLKQLIDVERAAGRDTSDLERRLQIASGAGVSLATEEFSQEAQQRKEKERDFWRRYNLSEKSDRKTVFRSLESDRKSLDRRESQAKREIKDLTTKVSRIKPEFTGFPLSKEQQDQIDQFNELRRQKESELREIEFDKKWNSEDFRSFKRGTSLEKIADRYGARDEARRVFFEKEAEKAAEKGIEIISKYESMLEDPKTLSGSRGKFTKDMINELMIAGYTKDQIRSFTPAILNKITQANWGGVENVFQREKETIVDPEAPGELIFGQE